MLYLQLLQHQRKQMLRVIRSKYQWIGIVGLLLLAGYVAFLFMASGFVFREMLRQMNVSTRAVPFINEHLLTVFVSLFLLRFFLQRSPRLQIFPYLHLPITPGRLITFFQFQSLLSLHNLLPLLFFVPFWVRHMVFTWRIPLPGALCWMAGVLAVLIGSHYGNTYLRAIIDRNAQQFTGVAAVIASLIVLDYAADASVLAGISNSIFGTLLNGAWLMAALLALLAWSLILASTDALKNRLTAEEQAPDAAPSWLQLPFSTKRGTVGNLMLLEMKLMWRNKRPRMFFLSAVIFGMLYSGIMLFHAERFASPFTLAVIGVFASGMFTLNYGQLMFSWESGYYDGMLSRAHTPRDLVKAKLLLLQFATAAFFFISLPMFMLLAPHLVGLHVAFLFYNTGVTCTLMMLLAISNQKRVDLRRQAALLNYEGFSLAHFLWFVPTLVPPALLLYMAGTSQQAGLYVVTLAGLAGLMLTDKLNEVFARMLVRRKYVMASGFRNDH
jgi:hypothetical protein